RIVELLRQACEHEARVVLARVGLILHAGRHQVLEGLSRGWCHVGAVEQHVLDEMGDAAGLERFVTGAVLDEQTKGDGAPMRLASKPYTKPILERCPHNPIICREMLQRPRPGPDELAAPLVCGTEVETTALG